MKETCEHAGVEHPIHFQCGDCEDTADNCNCFSCMMVFCEKCQEMIYKNCDEIRIAWDDKHPDLRMDVEGIEIELDRDKHKYLVKAL